MSLSDKINSFDVGSLSNTFFFYSKSHNVWFIANRWFIGNYDPSKSFKDTVIEKNIIDEDIPVAGLYGIYNRDERSAYILLYSGMLRKKTQDGAVRVAKNYIRQPRYCSTPDFMCRNLSDNYRSDNEKLKLNKKNRIPITCLTAYSKPIAQIADRYCDIILVGDSLGMVLYGMKTTKEVKLDTMILHCKTVKKFSLGIIKKYVIETIDPI